MKSNLLMTNYRENGRDFWGKQSTRVENAQTHYPTAAMKKTKAMELFDDAT